MKIKSLYTGPRDVTVKGAKAVAKVTEPVAKPIGKGTLYVTDHVELATVAASKATVKGTKATGRGLRLAGARTKVAFIKHADKRQRRKTTRLLVAEQAAYQKAEEAKGNVVVDNGATA